MILARVAGHVWGSVKAPGLEGFRLLDVVPLAAGGESQATLVAADALGAGIGEHVLVAHGSRVRDLTLGVAVPVKDVVIAIVAGWELA